ncbi:MAG: hypothetical protein A2X94_08130 [Bdellovibrionales bacterium GWB1_55_8]|nr:MAG: hypothetical protein A2X94_08130 [Bdellovibrionales bacterium GWB1_55_8]
MKLRCVVLQLGPLRSTFQAIAALKSAKELYPGLELHVVTTESSTEALQRVAWIDEVITLPAKALVRDITSGELREKHALGNLARWIGPLVQFRWDFLINWTYSGSSSYLAAMIPARVKLGLTRRMNDLTVSAPDGWSRYFQAIVQGDLPQNIHVTDILSTQLLTALQIHCGPPATGAKSLGIFSVDLGADGRKLSKITDTVWASRDRGKKWIAFQLEPTGKKPGWGTENWGKLAARILRRHPSHAIVLLGMHSESRAATHLLSNIRGEGQDPARVLNLVGKTDFNLWSTIAGSVSWVLSGNETAIPLASLLGTRVVQISTGSSRLDFGPYGNGHYVISTAVDCAACLGAIGAPHECRRSITPDAAYAIWSYGSSEWSHLRKNSLEKHFSRLGLTDDIRELRVHRSRIRTIDQGGGMEFEALTKRPTHIREWTAMVLEHLARELYCGWTPEIPQQLANVRLGTELLRELRAIKEKGAALAKIGAEANRISAKLSGRSAALKSENVMSLDERAELQSLSSELHQLENLLKRLAEGQPAISALVRLHAVMMHNLTGAQLAELSSEASLWYTQLADSAERLSEWAKESLLLARPVAIASSQSTHVSERTFPVDTLE